MANDLRKVSKIGKEIIIKAIERYVRETKDYVEYQDMAVAKNIIESNIFAASDSLLHLDLMCFWEYENLHKIFAFIVNNELIDEAPETAIRLATNFINRK